jgi:hypothetical protein
MLLVFLLFLQTPAGYGGPPPKRPPQAVALVEQARALPAEFGADTLLRLAGSKLVTEKKWQEELIDEAFWSGSRAPLPYQQWADRRDSLPTRQVRANRLEGLTLQTRAIEAMLPLDPGRALRMFEEMKPLTLPNPDCSEIITPDVSAYYRTAAAIFEHAFTPKQRRDEDDIAFLTRLVRAIDSPVQVPPALQSVLALNVTPEKRVALLTVIAGVLDHVSGSDRLYGAVEGSLVPKAMPEMAEAPAFVAALRNYILRHVQGRRCADNASAAGATPKSVAQFNALVLQLDPAGERFKPIPEGEARPSTEAGSYKPHLLWTSRRAKAVLAALQWLHHGNREPAEEHLWTLQERSSDEWLQHFQDTLKLMDGWKEDDEDSPDEYLCMATDALSDLAALAPPGKTRDRAMTAYLEVLEQRYASVENRNLWFTQFRQMLYRARFSKDPVDKAWILNAMARSANPVIALYSRLEVLDVAP